MTKAGERLLKSTRETRAYARGEAVKGLAVHAADKTGKPVARRRRKNETKRA